MPASARYGYDLRRDAAEDELAVAEPWPLGSEHRRTALAHPGEEVGLMLVHDEKRDAVRTEPVAAKQRERLAEFERQRLVARAVTDNHRRRRGQERGKRRHQSPLHIRKARMPPAPRPSYPALGDEHLVDEHPRERFTAVFGRVIEESRNRPFCQRSQSQSRSRSIARS